MPRRSLAEELLMEFQDEESGEDTWLVAYDFLGSKPPTRFYDNLRRVIRMTDGKLVQLSLFLTRDRRAVLAAVALVRHYGGEALTFRGELIDV